MSPVAGFAELVPKIIFEGNNHWNQLRDLGPAVGGNVLPYKYKFCKCSHVRPAWFFHLLR